VVGDLNVAASQRDVHAKLCWADMYGDDEKAEMAALLRLLPDVWRLRHPATTDAFTARSIESCRWGPVRHGGRSHARPGSRWDRRVAALRRPGPCAGVAPQGPAAMPGQPGDLRSLGHVSNAPG